MRPWFAVCPCQGTGIAVGLPAGRLLRRSWIENRPDVAYVATEGPLGWSAVRCARRLRIPTLSGLHTNYHRYSRHYHVGWLQPLILRYLRWFHNQTTGTLVPCENLRERLHSLDFKNVCCLGRGVDSQLFAPQRRCAELRRGWGVSDRELAILYLGRVAPEKNLGLAVDAYYAMKRVRNSLKFVIVGDGPLCASLRKAHADLIFCGMLTGEQLARHYASADVFLFPSETETFGNVTLEAMASGLAVIAYNYAAAEMHIRQGETGVLVPFGDAGSFLRSAVTLVRDPRSLRRIRRQAREYVASLGWQQLVERFEALLIGTCRNSRRATGSLMPRRELRRLGTTGGRRDVGGSGFPNIDRTSWIQQCVDGRLALARTRLLGRFGDSRRAEGIDNVLDVTRFRADTCALAAIVEMGKSA